MIILPHESLSGSRYLAAKNMPGLAHAKIGSAQSQTFGLLSDSGLRPSLVYKPAAA
jgi:hypothetical protein